MFIMHILVFQQCIREQAGCLFYFINKSWTICQVKCTNLTGAFIHIAHAIKTRMMVAVKTTAAGWVDGRKNKKQRVCQNVISSQNPRHPSCTAHEIHQRAWKWKVCCSCLLSPTKYGLSQQQQWKWRVDVYQILVDLNAPYHNMESL